MGTTGSTGGTAGASGSDGGLGGIGGANVPPPDAGPQLRLPSGCAPSEMAFACNPITNEGCNDAAGEACEYGIEEYFTCFPAPNDVPEGGACDWEDGPFCQPGHTCDFTNLDGTAGVCRKELLRQGGLRIAGNMRAVR